MWRKSILGAADARGFQRVFIGSYWNRRFLCTTLHYFQCFWVRWWVTAELIISLAGCLFFFPRRKGWSREKEDIFLLLLFSLQKGNPGAAAWTWARWVRGGMETGPPPSPCLSPLLKGLRESWLALHHFNQSHGRLKNWSAAWGA